MPMGRGKGSKSKPEAAKHGSQKKGATKAGRKEKKQKRQQKEQGLQA